MEQLHVICWSRTVLFNSYFTISLPTNTIFTLSVAYGIMGACLSAYYVVMHVCMYECMHVCMNVSCVMHVCMYECMHVCMNV